MNFKQKIQHTISRHSLIQSGDKVLVGVSGGADSIALLDILSELRLTTGFQVHAAHINHHLRKSADKDQNFVENFCAARNLPCAVKHLDLKKAIERGGSVEEIAREQRLKSLIKIAEKTHCNIIALAHHRDDLAETVLLRILRGTGLQGLQAILPKRKINGVLFIRPLINTERAEIENYLKKNKIKFRTDPTNKQTHFFRNKIRLELLPLLKKHYQKNIQEILCNLATTAGEDYDHLRNESLKTFSKLTRATKISGPVAIDLKKLQLLPTAIKRMSLRFAFEKVNGDTDALTLTHLRELEDLIVNRPTGAIVDLPHGIRAIKAKNSLTIR